ncbi:MAG TPA: PIN domain-containing protein [Thermoanaerobaculia bacterium]|nr:PIN domain-containing protein [Thermoanaerobaculia bacterium]
MQRIVLDANVLVSYLTGRHEKQYDAARVLLQEAEDGNLVAILPQFVVFEVTYVLQSLYGVSGDRLAATVRALVSFPVCKSSMTVRGSACWTSGPIHFPALPIPRSSPSPPNKLEAFGLAAYF